MDRPIIAITMGDPAGIGPEICIKACLDASVQAVCRPLVIGCPARLAQAAEVLGLAVPILQVARPEEMTENPRQIAVYDIGINCGDIAWGQVQEKAGLAAYTAVEKAVRLAQSGQVQATVTAPLNKEALHLAGIPFPGHTEIYAHLTGTRDFAMMLADGDLRVIHVSTHVSLREACDRATRARVLRTIQLANEALKQMGIEDPVIGVAGLNPHAGENGLFGREELDEIIPAIQDANALGIHAVGPVPPDTVFAKAIGGAYDMVVAMYHDQGHIPVKVKGFQMDKKTGAFTSVRGINMTLGLPIIRVSVDHGTAFDQAGKGTASDESLREALYLAARFAGGRA